MSLSTLAAPASHEIEVKHSRFRAIAAPVDDAGQALAWIRANGAIDATHNCWAYRVGADYRFNDDGEPGGTAGRPILQAIEGQRMDAIIVVVTRWYGGIKLGAGGLVRAYGGTAAECLRRAERIAIVATKRLGLRCDFAELGLLKSRLKDVQAEIEHEVFGTDGVELQLRLPDSSVDEAVLLVSDISRGRSVAKRLD